jgi:glycosyltransferase involved in cell wall biosynthesis
MRSYTECVVSLIHILGFKLVWTPHNLKPHEAITDNDELITQMLLKNSDRIIFHTEYARSDAIALGTESAKSVVIRHGGYPRFSTTRRSEQILQHFGLLDGHPILLLIGQFRPYKGTVELLDVLSDLRQLEVRVLIVGICHDKELKDSIISRASNDERVVVHLGFQSEEELSELLSVASYVCLPYLEITTSGVAVLALSHGCPVIAPRIGDFRELDDDVGIFYEDDDKYGLKMALLRAFSVDSTTVDNSQERMPLWHPLSWLQPALATLSVYNDLL